MDTAIVSTTLKYEGVLYRRRRGSYQVKVFGWHPNGVNPRFSWANIDDAKVPAQVKKIGLS